MIAPEKTRYRLPKRIIPLALVALALIVSFLPGCDDRGNPVFPARNAEGIGGWIATHVFQETFYSQVKDLPTTGIRVYTPPGYQGKASGRPYPVLYLLSPFRGDQFFYMHNGLQVVMDRMIAEGEIEPMIVVTLNGSGNAFGGSFYTNYITSGNFGRIVTTSLVARIDTQFNTFTNNLTDPTLRARLRGISGYEMGGYGAFRAAFADTSGGVTPLANFGSVSAVSAPLNFSDPTNGFPALFQRAIDEWGSFNDIDTSTFSPVSGFLLAAAAGFTIEDTSYRFSDTSIFVVDSIRKILDSSIIDTFIADLIDTAITAIDSSLDITLDSINFDSIFDTTVNFDTLIDSTILTDTLVDTTLIPNPPIIDTTVDTIPIPFPPFTFYDTTITEIPVDPDTTYDSTITVDTTIDSTFNPIDTLVDTTELIDTFLTIVVLAIDTTFLYTPFQDTNLVYNPPTDVTFPAFPNLLTGEDATLRMFLPFDSNAQIYNTIWPLWVANDMPNIVAGADPGIVAELSGNILVMATREAKYGHYQQDSMFVDYLNSDGISAVFREYSGYDGFADVDGAHYLFEVWPTLLKFHSDKIHPYIPAELQVEGYTPGF